MQAGAIQVWISSAEGGAEGSCVFRPDGAARPGSYKKIGDTEYVMYEENPEPNAPSVEDGGGRYRREGQDPLSGTSRGKGDRVLLKISGNRMELVRSGAIRTSMLFECGKRIPAEYTTPYGTIAMEVETTSFWVTHGENSICVTTDYRLYANGEVLVSKVLRIACIGEERSSEVSGIEASGIEASGIEASVREASDSEASGRATSGRGEHE